MLQKQSDKTSPTRSLANETTPAPPHAPTGVPAPSFGESMADLLESVHQFAAQASPPLSLAHAAEAMRMAVFRRQIGDNLSSHQRASMLYALYGARQAAAAHESLVPLLAATPGWMHLPAGHVWRALMDHDTWDDGQHAGLGFENEPGYMGAMYRGLGEMLKAHQDGRSLDLSLLKHLHGAATQGVYRIDIPHIDWRRGAKKVRKAAQRTRPTDTVRTRQLHSQDRLHLNKAIRGLGDLVHFGLGPDNLSQAGLAEFFANQALHPAPNQSMVIAERGANGKPSRIWSPAHWDGQQALHMLLPRQAPQCSEAMADKILALYTKEVQEAFNPDFELCAIARCVQRLAQLHMFIDGNSRTHGFLVLNKLLLERHKCPAMIADPMRFDGFSVNELVQDIKQGQFTFYRHCQMPTSQPASLNAGSCHPRRETPSTGE